MVRELWNYSINNVIKLGLGDSLSYGEVKLNLSPVAALIAALLIIVLTQKSDGGMIVSLFQPQAVLIVLGGTFCAALLNFNLTTLINALKSSLEVFKNEQQHIKVIDEILFLAHHAKQKGLFALNGFIENIQDPFLKRGIQLSMDYNNPQMIYDILKAEIAFTEEEEFINSRVFEALGGYAPTFGIVGAVMGLIHIMSYIQQPEVLGHGIAVAFVSTLYGVGFANLLFLPVAGKLKLNLREKILLKEVILQGIVSIQMGETPIVVEEKLLTYLNYHNKHHSIPDRAAENYGV